MNPKAMGFFRVCPCCARTASLMKRMACSSGPKHLSSRAEGADAFHFESGSASAIHAAVFEFALDVLFPQAQPVFGLERDLHPDDLVLSPHKKGSSEEVALIPRPSEKDTRNNAIIRKATGEVFIVCSVNSIAERPSHLTGVRTGSDESQSLHAAGSGAAEFSPLRAQPLCIAGSSPVGPASAPHTLR